MQCLRCQGHMVIEQFLDLRDDSGKCSFCGWHCLNCGEVLDPIIQSHRYPRVSTLHSISKKRKVANHLN